MTLERLADAAVLLRGYARGIDSELLAAINKVVNAAPMRHMETPGGRPMSAAMTNCGEYGWVTDRRGYRYTATDPLMDIPWPDMPETFAALARAAASEGGFADFVPDVCLINRYCAGARMGSHQDKDEKDFAWPIVSVSLGIPAVFLFGGFTRKDRPQRIPLYHGDVLVWGGPDRLRYHGIAPVREDYHPLCGEYRFNLTFRRAN